MRAGIAAIALVLMFGTAPAPASTCHVYPFRFELGEDTDMVLNTEDGRDCKLRIRALKGVELHEARLTRLPEHGGARINGTGDAYYRSFPGYRGKDSFRFTICGTQMGKTGCSAIRVKVFVH